MAKKGISKHSRAARRGEIDPFESAETKELASIPRLENTDTVSPLIRSSINKNQQLLNDKMSKISKASTKLKPGDNIVTMHNNKKKQHMVSKTIRTKHHKFQNIEGRLDMKIEKALKRKKLVGNLRKTGWERINEIAKSSLSNDLIAHTNSETKTDADIDEEIIDEMREDDEPLEVENQNPFSSLAEEE